LRPNVTTSSLTPVLTEPGSRYLNRELSWLDFNARVLALAEDATLPLLERVKFLAIYSQNLDEFFQVRVSGLLEQVEAGVGASTPEGMTPVEQVGSIDDRVRELGARVDRVFLDEVQPLLDKAGILIVSWDQLDEDDRSEMSSRFHEQIFPVLTPLSVDPAHPFPYVSSLSLNLAAVVRDPMTGLRRFARVKVPPLLPRFHQLDDERFIPVEQVIAAHLDVLFPGMEIVTYHLFRVTRDADVEVEEDEAEDLLPPSRTSCSDGAEAPARCAWRSTTG
jgi:polyphosphate kinase